MSTSFLSVPVQRSRLSPYSSLKPWNQLFLSVALVPFDGKCYLEAKIWAVGVLIAFGVSLLSDPLSEQNVCVFIYSHICLCIDTYIFIYKIYIYVTYMYTLTHFYPPLSVASQYSCLSI